MIYIKSFMYWAIVLNAYNLSVSVTQTCSADKRNFVNERCILNAFDTSLKPFK